MSNNTPKSLHWVDKQLGHLTGLFAVIGSLAILALLLIILVAVFWRYILNDPIFGIDDISVLVLAVVAASSVIYGARNNAHVSVNVITMFFGRKVTRITDIIMRTFAVAILGVASFALFYKACGFEKACITENLSVEHWPFFYVLGAAMILYTVHIFIQLVSGIYHFHDDKDPNEVAD